MPRVAFCCILVYFGVFLTFWCILVHSAAFWSILVHFGAFWCISVPVHLDAFFGALGARFRAWRRGGAPLDSTLLRPLSGNTGIAAWRGDLGVTREITNRSTRLRLAFSGAGVADEVESRGAPPPPRPGLSRPWRLAAP